LEEKKLEIVLMLCTFVGDWLKYNPFICSFSNINPVGGFSLPFPCIKNFDSCINRSADPSCSVDNWLELPKRKSQMGWNQNNKLYKICSLKDEHTR